jgi:hypothetical protein
MTRTTAAVGLRITGWIVLTLALAVLTTASSAAQVKPGDFITAQDANRVKDLVSPGVYWRVRNGMSMKIQPAERIDWPPPYKERPKNIRLRCA